MEEEISILNNCSFCKNTSIIYKTEYDKIYIHTAEYEKYYIYIQISEILL